MDDTVRRLVALCGLFAESTGRSISTVSRYATGSGETIARLQRGHAITTRRAERAIRFLSDEPLAKSVFGRVLPEATGRGMVSGRDAAFAGW